MGLVAKLSVKPLLYAMGVLLLVIVALSVALVLANGKADTARAQQQAAVALTRTVTTEREAWKIRADELGNANQAYGGVVSTLQAELKTAQDQAAALRTQSAGAVAQARAEAADADRTLKRFTAQVQAQLRQPDCARALSALTQACPALKGY